MSSNGSGTETIQIKTNGSSEDTIPFQGLGVASNSDEPFFQIMGNGWIKLHRSIDDWYATNDPKRAWLWITLLLLASHKQKEFIFSGETIRLDVGQFITGRNSLSERTGISPSTIERYLKEFEDRGQIEQQKDSRKRLITIVKYNDYQNVDSKRTADGQHVDTINKDKKDKKEKNIAKKKIPPLQTDVQTYCVERNNGINVSKFISYYEARGWMMGKSKMIDWKAAVRTWENNSPKKKESMYKELK